MKYVVQYGSQGPEVHPEGDEHGYDIVAIIPHEREDAEEIAQKVARLLSDEQE